MIVYDRVPISHEDASKLKAWLGSAEAQLFRECAVAKMNSHFFDSINKKTKQCESDQDYTKAKYQSEVDEMQGGHMRHFIEILDKLSSPKSGFFKLNIKT